jgi:Uma2 family endonuclease
MTDLARTRINASEYLRLYPETTQPMELIDGEVIILSSPTNPHQYIVGRLHWQLMNIVVPNQLGQVLLSPSDLHLDEHNIFQPDLFFIAQTNTSCQLAEDGYWYGAPDICIEVLSSSTAKRDRTVKFHTYAQNGVREYWIIDPNTRYVEVYTLSGSNYQQQGVYEEGDTFSSGVLPQFSVKVADLMPPL